MSRTKRIYIDSADRTSGNSNDITLRLGNNETLSNVESIMLTDASIPISFYNVTSDNNTFYWSERTHALAEAGVSSAYSNVTTYTFTITPGSYTTDTLMVAVEAAFEASIAAIPVTGGVDITFNSSTNKFSIAFTGTYFNGEYDIPYYSIGDIFDEVYFARYYPAVDVAKTLNGMMGFVDTLESQRPPSNGTTLHVDYRAMPSGSVVYTSTRLHTVYGLEYIYITSPLATGAVTSSANNSLSQILQKININSYYSELQFTSSGVHQEPVAVSSSSFSEMPFRIVDKDNNLIDLHNGNWSATLIVNYRNDVPDYIS